MYEIVSFLFSMLPEVFVESFPNAMATVKLKLQRPFVWAGSQTEWTLRSVIHHYSGKIALERSHVKFLSEIRQRDVYQYQAEEKLRLPLVPCAGSCSGLRGPRWEELLCRLAGGSPAACCVAPSLLVLMLEYEQPLAPASPAGETPEPCSLTRMGSGESARVWDRCLPLKGSDIKVEVGCGCK